MLLNVRTLSDRVGKFNVIGSRGTSTIDLVEINTRSLTYVTDLEIKDVGLSDHLVVRVPIDIEPEIECPNFSPGNQNVEIVRWNPDEVKDYE